MNLIANVCRFALKDDPSSDVIKAVIKLRDAISKDGLDMEARALSNLADKALTKNITMENKSITWSKSQLLNGNILTPSTPIPVDKENGSPLVEISFPADIKKNEKNHFFDLDVTNAIKGIVDEWEFSDKLKDNGISPSYSNLFFGEPGTGKTELAKYLAGKLGLPLVTARLDSLLSSYLGTSARNISTLFDFADKYHCVLLLDEFDAIAKYRDDSREVGEIKRVVNTLLQCLDRRKEKGIIIATTNHEKLLDPAVWRRFQNKICIKSPSFKVRGSIISSYLKPMSIDDNQMRFLSNVLEGFTPSDIENCISFIKRFTIINSSSEIDLFPAIKSFFVINAHYSNDIVDKIINGTEPELAKYLVSNINYSAQDVATLFDKHKSTVSRWLKG
jgi:hypothetical protein